MFSRCYPTVETTSSRAKDPIFKKPGPSSLPLTPDLETSVTQLAVNRHLVNRHSEFGTIVPISEPVGLTQDVVPHPPLLALPSRARPLYLNLSPKVCSLEHVLPCLPDSYCRCVLGQDKAFQLSLARLPASLESSMLPAPPESSKLDLPVHGGRFQPGLR